MFDSKFERGWSGFFLCPFLLLTGVAVCLDFLFVFGMSSNSFRFLLFPKYQQICAYVMSVFSMKTAVKEETTNCT